MPQAEGLIDGTGIVLHVLSGHDMDHRNTSSETCGVRPKSERAAALREPVGFRSARLTRPGKQGRPYALAHDSNESDRRYLYLGLYV
jgi:hypothetical protein